MFYIKNIYNICFSALPLLEKGQPSLLDKNPTLPTWQYYIGLDIVITIASTSFPALTKKPRPGNAPASHKNRPSSSFHLSLKIQYNNGQKFCLNDGYVLKRHKIPEESTHITPPTKTRRLRASRGRLQWSILLRRRF